MEGAKGLRDRLAQVGSVKSKLGVFCCLALAP